MKPVTNRQALQLASRIDAGLQRMLGEGIDLSRMLADPLYRRDVLLVCDACAPGELATLAQDFRAALAHKAQAEAVSAEPARSSADADSGVFSPSRFFNSLFGAWSGNAAGDAAEHHPTKARQRGWFGR